MLGCTEASPVAIERVPSIHFVILAEFYLRLLWARSTERFAVYPVFSCRHAVFALSPVSCVVVSFHLLQTFVGLTALLAAFPPCLGTGDYKEPEVTQPLLSGSVCRVRDSLDFLDVSTRTAVVLIRLDTI